MKKIEELEKYLDDDTYEAYSNIFNRDDLLNNYIVKDALKTALSDTRIKTLKDLLIIRVDCLLYKINALIYQYNDMTIDNSIDHTLFMLKQQYLNLTKLNSILNKTEDIDKMRYIYLNANAMVKLSDQSICYLNDLLKKMELNAKGITFIDNSNFDISCNETKMLFITSNVKNC